MAEGAWVRQFRLHGAVRGAIVAYGIAACTWLLPRPAAPGEPASSLASSALQMLLVGIGFQVLVMLVRSLLTRYERANGMEGQIAPTAMSVFELLADGLTVLLFALATMQGILRHADTV